MKLENLVALLAVASLLMIAASGVPIRTITVMNPAGGGATISRDGKTLIYIGNPKTIRLGPAPECKGCERVNDMLIHKVDLANGTDQVINTSADLSGADVYDPGLSPDGNKLLFGVTWGSNEYYQQSIDIMNIDGTGLKTLTPD
ncbi:MAG TPA: hypothetical protein VMB26_09485, partial [Candidatus Binataceae bacterium]|nr:hypothetical protein [Candidatus Binataceae bacterium]